MTALFYKDIHHPLEVSTIFQYNHTIFQASAPMIYWAKFFVPLPISLVVFVILFLTKSPLIAESFLGGALACWLGQLCFLALLMNKIASKKSTGFLSRFFLAEFIKLSVYALAFVGITQFFQLSLAPSILGFSVNLALFLVFSFKIFR